MLNYKPEREMKATHAGQSSCKAHTISSSSDSKTNEMKKKRSYAEVLSSESNYDSTSKSNKAKETDSEESDKAMINGDLEIPIE